MPLAEEPKKEFPAADWNELCQVQVLKAFLAWWCPSYWGETWRGGKVVWVNNRRGCNLKPIREKRYFFTGMFCCWVSQHLQLTGKLNTIPVADTIQLRGFYYYFFKYTNWKPCVFSVTVASTDLTGRLIESLSKVGHKNILSLCEQVFAAHFTGSNFCLCLLAALTQLKIEICSPCLVFSRCNCSFFFFLCVTPCVSSVI